MDNDRLDQIAASIAEGARPGFMRVSKSRYWMPWMFPRKVERIEIGLFEDCRGVPLFDPFSVEWFDVGEDEPRHVLTNATPEAWLTIAHLPNLPVVISSLYSDSGSLLGPDEFAELLLKSAYLEETGEYILEDDLPLPPDEAGDDVAGTDKSLNDKKWLGPHEARTQRFFDLISSFISELNSRHIPVFDLYGGGHPQFRLWEVFSGDEITDESMRFWGKTDKLDTPHLLIDLSAYLRVATRETQIAYLRSGGQIGVIPDSIIRPISEVEFHVFGDPSDRPTVDAECKIIADRLGLFCDASDQAIKLSLPDLEQYREHGWSPD